MFQIPSEGVLKCVYQNLVRVAKFNWKFNFKTFSENKQIAC